MKRNFSGYAVKSPSGETFFIDSLRHNKQDAIAAFLDSIEEDFSWEKFYQHGHRCVPVRVVEVKR